MIMTNKPYAGVDYLKKVSNKDCEYEMTNVAPSLTLWRDVANQVCVRETCNRE
jgi:hypothetical protein